MKTCGFWQICRRIFEVKTSGLEFKKEIGSRHVGVVGVAVAAVEAAGVVAVVWGRLDSNLEEFPLFLFHHSLNTRLKSCPSSPESRKRPA